MNQFPECPVERFFAKVQKTDSCWIWTGLVDEKGYGLFKDRGRIRTHRWSYRYHKGEIPAGMYVCHRCDNPPCVNPEHLFLGTPKDNSQDMVRKGRQVKSESEKRRLRMAALSLNGRDAAVMPLRLSERIKNGKDQNHQ